MFVCGLQVLCLFFLVFPSVPISPVPYTVRHNVVEQPEDVGCEVVLWTLMRVVHIRGDLESIVVLCIEVVFHALIIP